MIALITSAAVTHFHDTYLYYLRDSSAATEEPVASGGLTIVSLDWFSEQKAFIFLIWMWVEACRLTCDNPELLQLSAFLHTKQYGHQTSPFCTTGIEDDYLCLSLPAIYEGIWDLFCPTFPNEQSICLHIEILLNYCT